MRVMQFPVREPIDLSPPREGDAPMPSRRTFDVMLLHPSEVMHELEALRRKVELETGSPPTLFAVGLRVFVTFRFVATELACYRSATDVEGVWPMYRGIPVVCIPSKDDLELEAIPCFDAQVQRRAEVERAGG